MFDYVLKKEKNLIEVLKEGKVVGKLSYIEKDGVVGIDMYKIPVNNDKDSFENYFEVMSIISKELKEKFENFEKIVWGSSSEIKDYDLYASELEKEKIKSKGKIA